jgi:hypothetical protein
MNNWLTVLLIPAKVVLAQIGQFLVNVLLVIVILIVGWAISRLIKTVVVNVLKKISLDKISERFELSSILAKGGIKYSLSELIAVVCYWLAILVTFVVALTTVNLVTGSLLDKIVSYIPNIVAAIFILVVGMFLAALLKTIVQAAASNAGIGNSALLGRVTEIIVIVFAILMILEQLKVGIKISEITLSIILGSVGLGFALAFGLGCRDIAERTVTDLIEKLKKK